jgi:hypothetical protein
LEYKVSILSIGNAFADLKQIEELKSIGASRSSMIKHGYDA